MKPLENANTPPKNEVNLKPLMIKHLNDIVGGEFQVTPDNRDALNKVYAYLSNPGDRGLLLMGTVGTGKNTLMECVRRTGKDLYRWGIVAFTAPQIRDKYYDATFGDQYSLKHKVHLYRRLLINDLGMERDYASGVNLIQNIMFDRYESGQVTFGTTNLTITEFYERYNDDKNRMRDRFPSMFEFINLNGKSHRPK